MALWSETAIIKAQYDLFNTGVIKTWSLYWQGVKEYINTHSERGKNDPYVLFIISLFTNYAPYATHKYQ